MTLGRPGNFAPVGLDRGFVVDVWVSVP